MKTIITTDSGFHLFGLFIEVNEQGAKYVGHPEFATTFATKEEAKMWVKENLRDPEDYSFITGKKLEKLITEFKEWYKEWYDSGMSGNSVALINKTYNYMFDPNKHTLTDMLDWLWWYCVSPSKEHTVAHKIYNSWSYPRGHFPQTIFWNFAKYSNFDTREDFYTVEISFPRDKTFESFRDELNMLLDRYKFDRTVECNGHEGIGINLATDDCNQSGIPYLVMLDREKDLWFVVKSAHRRNYQECSPRSLEECFAFMIKEEFTYN